LDNRPVFDRLEPLHEPFIDSFSKLNAFTEEFWPRIETDFPPNLNHTLRFFVRTIVSRARAVFMLLQTGSHWESEIILRSLLEAAVRCLTFARRTGVEELLAEFWIELQASSDRKAALRAAMAQELIPEGSTDNPVFEALQNSEWFEIEPTTNKQRRRYLDQKWSLPELVKKLQDEATTTRPIVGLDAMFHSYGLQSEILHVSSKYYDLLWDRTIRGDDLVPLENAHYCRQMTDAIQLTAFCIVLSLERLGVQTEKLKTPIDIANAFSNLVRPYQAAFDRSQGFA
jgi:Family of unknown function (DUF5677)